MYNNGINIIEESKMSNKNLYNKIMKRFSMFDGVGLDLTGCQTYDEALSSAGIDYTAEKKPLYLEDGTLIKNFFAMSKSDDPSIVLGITGNQYNAVSNREAFSVAEEIVDEGYARYEVGGPSMGAKHSLDYAKSFLVLRGDDFYGGDNDIFHSFIVFNNSFDGSTGIQAQVICERVVCLNGMVRYLGGQANQIRINIQHSATANQRIELAKAIIKRRVKEIELIKEEAQLFMGTHFTRKQFEQEIIPLVLKEKGIVEKDKERERGQQRIDDMVAQLIQAYDAEDTQNYNGSAYKVILAMSDFESHSEPLRDTGNGHIYMNRILKGMKLTTAVATYIATQNNLKIGGIK